MAQVFDTRCILEEQGFFVDTQKLYRENNKLCVQDMKLYEFQLLRHFFIFKKWIKPDDGVRTTLDNEITMHIEQEAPWDYDAGLLSSAIVEFKYAYHETIILTKPYMRECEEETSYTGRCSYRELEWFQQRFMRKITMKNVLAASPYHIFTEVLEDEPQIP